MSTQLVYCQLGVLGLNHMTLKKPQIQPNLFDIKPFEEEVNSIERDRIDSVVKNLMEPMASGQQSPEWLETYFLLRRKQWDVRKAIYIAWASMPREKRFPKTQEELAKDYLGLTSDRVISKWRKNNPAIEDAIHKAQTLAFFESRGAVLAALSESAQKVDYKNHQDRKLFLTMSGDYIAQSEIRGLLLRGELKLRKNKEDYTQEELEAMAAELGEDYMTLITMGTGEDEVDDVDPEVDMDEGVVDHD